MLVFTRRRGDAVAMGDRRDGIHAVKVTVLEIRGSQVKLGFEAAGHIAVHRWEVWQRIRDEIAGGELPPKAPQGPADRWENEGGHLRPAAALLATPQGQRGEETP